MAESSLALAHYVSGYVTKAEKSSMQEIWQDISESKSIYSRLWSFGVRSLRSRECDLYEASDLLLGDHLTEKLATVHWVDVSMPPKRSRRLKDHKVLEQMAKHNPDTEDIYEDNLLDTYYPQRPESLEDICLYDLVPNYNWQSRDKDGNSTPNSKSHVFLTTSCLIPKRRTKGKTISTHSYCSLFPLEMRSVLLQNETAEEAFHRLMNDTSSAYHAKLQRILDAQSKIKDINKTWQADGEEKRVN